MKKEDGEEKERIGGTRKTEVEGGVRKGEIQGGMNEEMDTGIRAMNENQERTDLGIEKEREKGVRIDRAIGGRGVKKRGSRGEEKTEKDDEGIVGERGNAGGGEVEVMKKEDGKGIGRIKIIL